MKIISQLRYILYDHYKSSSFQIIISCVFALFGIIIGVILSFGEVSFLGLIKNGQNVIEYINGSAKYISVFWQNFFASFVGVAIIFVFCLNYFSSFLSLIYIAYQSSICTLAINQVVSQFGFAGVFTTIFSIIPINICLLISIIFFYTICQKRAKEVYKYKQKFVSSFNSKFWILFGLSLACFLIVNIFFNLIYPLIFKGIFVINY